MSVKFYVDNVEKNIETGASFRATQDNSLDDGSLVLEWISSEETIKPRTPVRIDELDSDNQVIHEWNFSVLSDDVEPVTKSNDLFSHRLTLIQNTNDLTHRLLRNSNFQQPLEEKKSRTVANGYVFAKKSSGSFTTVDNMVLPIHYDGSTPNPNIYRKDRLYIDPKEKINDISLDIDTFVLCWTYPAKTDERINLTWVYGSERNWLRNAHNPFDVVIEYSETENGAVTQTSQPITVNVGSRANKTQVQTLSKAFFGSCGAGWYNVALVTTNTSDLPSFSLTSDEISFAVTEDVTQAVSDIVYPTIQARVELKLRVDTYYFTLYDVLEAIQKQSVKKLSNIDRATTPYSLTNLNDLKNIIAPDFQFNGLNVFDAVNQVFTYIDAVPTLSKTKELNYELLNEFDGEQLASDYAFADKKTRIEDKYYDNQIITQYSNAKQPTYITYPGNNFYKKLETNKKGVVSDSSDYYIKTSEPIESIDELNIYCDKLFDFTFPIDYTFHYGSSDYHITSVSYKGFYLPFERIDISRRVVESTVFGTLSVGSYSDPGMNQSNTILFNRGSNSFQVGLYEELGYTYQRLSYVIERCWHEQWDYNYADISMARHDNWTDPHLYQYYYSIKYFATFDGQTMIESPENKKEGQFVIAQSSSSTALNKMGSNMLGFIAKTGNESKAVTMQLNTYDNRLVKGSIWVDTNGDKWIANIVKITFSTGLQIITEVEFVKNFNMISQRTQVDEEIKYSVINRSLVSKGFENVNEYLYFSTSSIETSETTSFTDDLVESLLKGTFANDYTQPHIDYCSIHFDSYDSTYVPIHTYGLGNVLCFEFNYDDPKLAGSYVTLSGEIKSINVLYTENGFGDKMYVLMRSNQLGTKIQSDYPIVPSTDYNDILIGFNYDYCKRPNEILSFNYGVALMSIDSHEIYFGEEFLAQNHLIPNNKYTSQNRQLYMYVSEDETYGINDKMAKGDRKYNLSATVDMSNRSISFSADAVSGDDEVVSWCIADQNGNIYIACNQTISPSSSHFNTKLYFAKKQKRIE